MSSSNDSGARERMVREQIAARGIDDPALLVAFTLVPREAFVAPELAAFAYDDGPLPIEAGQTISQPYIVARMISAARVQAEDRVLEIGTGSGYAAAILACIAREVFTVERHAVLADIARERLTRLKFANVAVLHGDGTLGWDEHAPYDVILASAGAPSVPSPLKQQLAIGGRLVLPVGVHATSQRLVRITRVRDDEFREDALDYVHFVPLIGAQGWSEDAADEV